MSTGSSASTVHMRYSTGFANSLTEQIQPFYGPLLGTVQTYSTVVPRRITVSSLENTLHLPLLYQQVMHSALRRSVNVVSRGRIIER